MAVPATIQPLAPNQISLNGQRYTTVGPVVKTKATQFSPPQRTGSPDRGDQQFASEVVWDDLTGGLGVQDMNEQEFPDRFSESSLFTMIKKRWMLPPRRRQATVNGAAFSANIAGMVTYAGQTYVVGGTTVKRIPVLYGADSTSHLTHALRYYTPNTGVGGSWGTAGSEYPLPAAATGPPILWKGNIWIPCGSQLVRYNVGSTRFDTVTNASGGGAIPAQLLAVFDEDLYILQNTGAVVSTDDNATSVTLVARGGVDTFEQLNGLTIHRNAAGEPTPFITTERDLLAHEYWTAKVHRTGIRFSDGDLNNGKGLATWDGSLWLCRGLNVYQILEVRLVRGPNTGDGMSRDHQGYCVALEPSFDNFLVAAVDGGTYTPRQIPSVLAYNRKGWHTLVRGTDRPAASGHADAFTRADSSSAIGGSGWTVVAGTWGISSNKAYRSASTGHDLVIRSGTGISNGVITAVVDQSGSPTYAIDRRIIFRYSDIDNYLYVRAYAASAIAPYALALRRRQAGVEADLSTTAPLFTNGGTISVVFNGSTIDVHMNGLLVINATSTFNQSADSHGLGAGSTDLAGRWDDFDLYTNQNRFTALGYAPSGRITNPGTLFFNDGTVLEYIFLYDTTDNPNQWVFKDFESSGQLVLPWFDANLSEVQKTFVSVQIRTLDCTANRTVKVYFASDDGTTWTQMYDETGATKTITADGATTLFFDTDRLGSKYFKLRLRVDLETDDTTISPKVLFAKVRYLKELDVLYSYTLQVNLSAHQPDQVTAAQARANLDTAVELKTLVPFAYHGGESGDTKYVLISGYTGPTGAGPDETGSAYLTLIEVTPQ